MFIEINNLKKSFGSDSNRVEVLRGVDFSIEKGDICVLLGKVYTVKYYRWN